MIPAPVKPTVSLGLFQQLDIRAGTIVAVEDLPRARKLIRLRVDFGDRERTVLAGLKQEREHPSELVGRQTLFVVNLEPKWVMGELSEGLLLDIGFADGLLPVLAVPEAPVPNGARAG